MIVSELNIYFQHYVESVLFCTIIASSIKTKTMKPNIYMREIMELTGVSVEDSLIILEMMKGDLSEMTQEEFEQEVKNTAMYNDYEWIAA